jgi:hypothetical protein
MIFDKLCAMADAWLPQIRGILEHAYIIRADIIPHQVLSKRIPLEQVSRIAQEFRMPSTITAIEDAASCVVLADLEEDNVGLVRDRMFIECVPSDPLVGHHAYSDPPEIALEAQQACATMPAEAVSVSIGRFCSPIQREGSFEVLGELASLLIGTPDALTFAPDLRGLDPPLYVPLLSAALKNAFTAVEELVHISGLPAFTGWPLPEVARPQGRLRRSNERFVFRVMTDGHVEVPGGAL